MTVKLILARNMKEAHAFAHEELGLSNGQFRVVNHADTLRAVRNADLYMVPGHDKRHDRFAIKSALRYTRLNIIDVGAGEHLEDGGSSAPLVEAVKDNLIPAGEQMTVTPITEDEASAFLLTPADAAQVEAALIEETEAVPPLVDLFDRTTVMQELHEETAVTEQPAPAEPEVKRRRRKCKECGTMHYKDDACAESAE